MTRGSGHSGGDVQLDGVSPWNASGGNDPGGRGISAPRGRALRVRGSMIIGFTVGLAALVGVVAWWSSAPSSPGSAPGQLAAALAQLSGLVASVLICVQLLLISRVPWLVKIIGLGPMVRWHRPVGSAVLILVLAHVVLV